MKFQCERCRKRWSTRTKGRDALKCCPACGGALRVIEAAPEEAPAWVVVLDGSFAGAKRPIGRELALGGASMGSGGAREHGAVAGAVIHADPSGVWILRDVATAALVRVNGRRTSYQVLVNGDTLEVAGQRDRFHRRAARLQDDFLRLAGNARSALGVGE